MSYQIDLITVRAAAGYLQKEKESNGSYVFLSDVQQLCLTNGHKPVPKQGWSFRGDWKRSVQPYFAGGR